MDHKVFTTPNDLAEDLAQEIKDTLLMGRAYQLRQVALGRVKEADLTKPIAVTFVITTTDWRGDVLRMSTGGVVWQHSETDEVSGQRALERLKESLGEEEAPF